MPHPNEHTKKPFTVSNFRGEGQLWRRRGEEPDGDHGIMCAPWRQIEKVGDRILRPYVPLGTNRKGEGIKLLSFKTKASPLS